MTGRRLLDVAAIFKASRGVAAKHVALRQHQLDTYSMTSSLAQAVKSQTDRVTLTVKAASSLAERFNGPGPACSTRASQSRRPLEAVSTPSQDGASGTTEDLEKKNSLSQDYFYERLDRNVPAEVLPDDNLGVKQEKAKRYPLPDGSIPPAEISEVQKRDEESYSRLPHTEPLKALLTNGRVETDDGPQPTSYGRTSITKSEEGVDPAIAEEAKKLQRQAEQQIPSQAAEHTPAAVSEEPNLKDDQDQVVCYTPPSSHGQVLAALPRVKIPKKTKDVQKNDEHVPDAQINQDVFYSPSSKTEEERGPQKQAVPVQEQLSDEAYAELFHSPKVARMLGGQPKPSKPSKGLEMSGAQKTTVKQTKIPQEKDHVSFSIRTSGQESQGGAQNRPNRIEGSKPSQAKGGDDVDDLAGDMAKEAGAMPADPSQVSYTRCIHAFGAD